MTQGDRTGLSVDKTHRIFIWLFGIMTIANLFSAILYDTLRDVIFVLLFFGGAWSVVVLTPHLFELLKSKKLEEMHANRLRDGTVQEIPETLENYTDN